MLVGSLNPTSQPASSAISQHTCNWSHVWTPMVVFSHQKIVVAENALEYPAWPPAASPAGHGSSIGPESDLPPY